MTPSLSEVLDTVVPFALPLRVPFRGVRRRVGLLIPGPAGWGEFSPFDDYPPPLSARWLAAALEAAYRGWPDPLRDEVVVNAIVPAVAAEHVLEVLPWTPRTVKVKVTGDLSADLARVAAVREAIGPDAQIRLDVNAGWTLQQAHHDLPRLALAAGGLEYVEQPLPSLADITELRRAVDVPIAVDETLRLAADPFDPALLAQVRRCADVAVLKVAPLGGVANTLRLAQALQLPVVVSGAMESAVGLSAGIAAAAALPQAPRACGLGTGALLAADVVAPPLIPVDGRLSAMKVVPDPAALAAARAAVGHAEAEMLRLRLEAAWGQL